MSTVCRKILIEVELSKFYYSEFYLFIKLYKSIDILLYIMSVYCVFCNVVFKLHYTECGWFILRYFIQVLAISHVHEICVL